MEWKYNYKLSEKIPTKTSVSKIKEEKNKENKLQVFLKQELEGNQQNIDENLNIPEFEKEEKITAAQKGTLIHLCIKNLDESKEYEKEDITELIENLRIKNIITQKEAESIKIQMLYDYTKSSLFKKLKSAKQIYKEEPFYINIPAKEIYGEEVEENVLVQGIIDLYYIDKDGKIILVDYKTDYVKNEKELIDKYREQLILYKRAIEKGLDIEVDKMIVYSTFLQKEIQIC